MSIKLIGTTYTILLDLTVGNVVKEVYRDFLRRVKEITLDG